ncbi:MAG TPA: hypothetical protein PLK78_16935 [Verrucomicrobiota bacterium]|nr:hypothetical protein [Verrucomicrobiota bacterium]
MAAFKVDGDFTVATACSAARKSFPFPGDNTSFIVEQDFMQFFANFTPLALSTPHPTFTDAYLVEETPLQDLGGGVARWTRRYAQIPATRNEYEAFAYQFVGYIGITWGINVPTFPGRHRFTKTVVSRLKHEYFLCATGQTYETPDLIPIIPAQAYKFNDLVVDYLWDSSGPHAVAVAPSEPSRAEYEAWVAAGAEIVAEDSRISRWLGNIYERVTRYVVAQ